MSFRKKIADFISPPKKEAKTALAPMDRDQVAVGIVNLYQQQYGQLPSTTFSAQWLAFSKNPIMKESIQHTAMEIVGSGYFITSNPRYKMKLPRPLPEGGTWTAQECIEDFCNKNNLDENLLGISTEMVAFGNSFGSLNPQGYQPLPIKYVNRVLGMKTEGMAATQKIPITQQYDLVLAGPLFHWSTENWGVVGESDLSYRSLAGIPTAFDKTDLALDNDSNTPAGYFRIPWGKFVHFRHNVLSSTAPLGVGCILGFIESYDGNTPDLLSVYNSVLKNLNAGFGLFCNPIQILSCPQLTPAQLMQTGSGGVVTSGISYDFANMPSSGGRLTVNTPAKIETVQSRRDSGWDKWIDFVFDAFIMSLGDPSLKSSVESGFTEASIRGSIELFRKKIQNIRSSIKRQLEDLFIPVLKEYGFNPEKAKIEFWFNADPVNYTPSDVFAAQKNGIITVSEARDILREKTRWEIEEGVPEELLTQPSTASGSMKPYGQPGGENPKQSASPQGMQEVPT